MALSTGSVSVYSCFIIIIISSNSLITNGLSKSVSEFKGRF